MYAVFVDDGFDSVYESKEEAKEIAAYFRAFEKQLSRIKKLTKEDKRMLGIEDQKRHYVPDAIA